jgi:hypothetical protein
VCCCCCCGGGGGGVATGISFCMCMYVYGSELLKSILYGGVLAQMASKQGISQVTGRVLKKASWTCIPMSSVKAVRCSLLVKQTTPLSKGCGFVYPGSMTPPNRQMV